jgi:hypothetical protein
MTNIGTALIVFITNFFDTLGIGRRLPWRAPPSRRSVWIWRRVRWPGRRAFAPR